jgi:EpsI family protein
VSNTFLSLIVAAMLALTLGASKWSDSRPPDTLRHPLEQMPAKLGSWEMEANSKLDPSVLAKLTPTSYIDRKYRKGNNTIELFVAYYAIQRAGESMHSPKNCLPGAGWEIWDYGTAKLALDGKNAALNEYFIQNGPSRLIVLYWYQTRDRILASEYSAKAAFIWDRMTKGHTGGSIIRIITSERPQAVEDEEEFARLAIPAMQEILGR